MLVLDDDPQICRLIKRCLAPTYTIACCTDAVTALELLNESCPDLIFVDVHLGLQDPSGISFVWRLRENKYTGTICMLSGDRTQETALCALIAGANDYLVKGEIAASIKSEVDLMLAKKQTRDHMEDHVRESARLRSDGLSMNQRALLADWAAAGMPDLPDFARQYEISIQALSKRFLRIQEKLGLQNRSQLSSLMTTVMGFGARKRFEMENKKQSAVFARRFEWQQGFDSPRGNNASGHQLDANDITK